MNPTPKVSVVMPAFNAAAYLDQSIQSILNQSFQDFEFIIINDGSSDDTKLIVNEYEKLDVRIRAFHEHHEGMIAALDRGCELARGEYIARMDADDVSFAYRLQRQVEYMEKHPRVGVVGSWICIEKNGLAAGTWCPPTSPNVLKWTMFFGVCVAHPSVLMRREVISRLAFYRPAAVHGEDVDLWLRASAITEFGNVPEVLLKYRVWERSASQVLFQSRREAHVRLLKSFIKEYLNADPTLEAVAGLRRLRVGPLLDDPRQIHLTADLVKELYRKFMKDNNVEPQERSEISWDVAKKLARLALLSIRCNRPGFLFLLMQALRIDCRLLRPSAIMRGVRASLEGRGVEV
jgi:glycosyltransferase involved in cell wall biosynthesis